MTTTTTTIAAARCRQLPEEILERLHPSLIFGIWDCLETGDDEGLADCLIDLTEDLQSLQEEFPGDWEMFAGDRSPAHLATGHISWLLNRLA